MDPNQTVRDIVRGLTHAPKYGGYEDSVDLDRAIGDLVEWLERGGFEPSHEYYGDVCQAAYWHYSETNAGLWSNSYAMLCAVSRIYSPGDLERGPEHASFAYDLYNYMRDL